jgi:(p)ppGpp synthase/HD superfamily hydrolase
MSTRLGTLAGTVGADDALAFLAEAYGRRLRRAGRTDEHPIAVGRLLAADGQSPHVVVAGLLHDVLEDTDASPAEVHARFGTYVGRLVEAVTQDASVEAYGERKAALRRRIIESGPEAATISLADKVAKLQLARQRPRKRRMRHYQATLEDVEERYGRSPLSGRLSELLARW